MDHVCTAEQVFGKKNHERRRRYVETTFFYYFLYTSISLFMFGLFVYIDVNSNLSLSLSIFLSLIYISLKKNHQRRRRHVKTTFFFIFKKTPIFRLLDLIVCRSMNTSIYLSIRSILCLSFDGWRIIREDIGTLRKRILKTHSKKSFPLPPSLRLQQDQHSHIHTQKTTSWDRWTHLGNFKR